MGWTFESLGFLGRVTAGMAALAAVSAVLRAEVPNATWVEAKTSQCRVIGDEDPAKVEAMALSAQRLVSALERLVPGVSFSREEPMSFYAFGSNEGFRSFNLGGPDAGYFVSHRHGVYAAFVTGQEPTRQIYRQVVLMMLEARYPGLPEWFRQGVADVYSNIEIENGEVRLGLPIQGHLWLLRSPDNEMPFLDVFEAGPDEAEQISGFNVWAWALVHYLAFGDDELRLGVDQYLERIANLERPMRAFRQAFRISPEQLSERAISYVRGDTMPYLRLSVEALPVGTAAVRRLTPIETTIAFADLTVHTQPGSLGRVLDDLRSLADRDLEMPALWTILGEAEAISGSPRAALSALRKSAALDPRDFKTNLLLGELLLESSSSQGGDSEMLQEATDVLERAVGLRPQSSVAWERLAFAYARRPDVPDRAVEAGAQALRLAPGRTDIVYNLLLAHARRGEVEDVRRLLTRLEALGSATGRATRGRELLLQLMLKETPGLMRANRLDDAIAVLTEVQARTTDEQLRATAKSWMSRVQTVKGYNSFVDQYNDAVRAYSSEHWDVAMEALDRLAAVARPGGQAKAVERLRKEVEYWRE